MIDGENIVGSCDLRDGDRFSRAVKACDFIASACGLSFASTEVSADEKNIYRYYTYGSDMGLRFEYYNDSDVSESYSAISMYVAYKDADGKFNVASSGCGSVSIPAAGDYSDSSEKEITLYSTRLLFGNLTMIRFMRRDYIQTFEFMPFSIVDYFSGKTRAGMYVGGTNWYSYDESNKLLENMDEVVLGGTSYPSGRSLMVAAPVMLKSPSFYGPMNNASCLYHVTGVSSLFGNKIQIGGVTFRNLYSSWFIRC